MFWNEDRGYIQKDMHVKNGGRMNKGIPGIQKSFWSDLKFSVSLRYISLSSLLLSNVIMVLFVSSNEMSFVIGLIKVHRAGNFAS